MNFIQLADELGNDISLVEKNQGFNVMFDNGVVLIITKIDQPSKLCE